jgi:hypothetical protein
MKKLLLLLILSFFSAQSLAGSCPDGSEPVKSVSDDGSYFEFKCSNKKASEFQDNSGILLADEAKEMLDDHVIQSELLKVPLPTDNKVIKDYQRYKDYRKNILAKNYHFTNYLWKEKVDGLALTKEVCMTILTEFKIPTTPTIEEQQFKRCDAAFETYAVLNFEDGIKLYEELILAIASAKPDNWIYKDSGKNDFNPRDYNLWGVLSTYLMFYAVNYDQFDYTVDERQIINNYFKSKAMIERLDRAGDRSRTSLCPIKDPMKMTARYTKTNNCGSVRFRFAPAELALAVVMQDEDLWAKGLWDLDYTLSMIEKEGFFVPHSAKGCKALGYTWDTSKLLSLNVEMLKLADFNLLDYKTRHGKTIAEAYEMLFKQYEDITISNHIAKKGVGSASCGTKPYKTHEEFLILEFDPILNPSQTPDPAKLSKAYETGQARVYEDFLNWSIRFVSEKHPEWLNDTPTLNKVRVHEWLGAYFKVQAFEIFNANVMSESDNIWEEKEKQFESQKYAIRKEATSKLSIFKISGEPFEETFDLNLDLIDFIEIEPRNKPNMVKDFQLYKTNLNGILQSRSDSAKKINLQTVVYKMADNSQDYPNPIPLNEQRLVILSVKLMGHHSALFDKCGNVSSNGSPLPGLISANWTNFIIKTDDIDSAKDQQCYYDYFKEANDEEAFELFQAVLAGTKSILYYLQNPEKIAAKKIEELDKSISELSIFKLQDGELTLTLDKVDFAETEPAQKQKKDDNSELHKAEINGSLNLSSSKQIDLKTLVFQQATDKANRLSINVGDLTPPEMNPFKRHRDSLQKKCGMGLMNQYDWLSFISETSDIKNAKNQQCHYDYFKEASDEEAFELFQAVLAGTESILYYLQNPEKIVSNQEQEKANNRATIQAEKTAKLKGELSIFKIDGETFNLALAKGDFIETGPFELERSAEYLQPFQLHKAFVQGSLRLNSNKKINFKTLVFKHADTKERKLVIHVGEMSLERHSDFLQKKCGPKVMEWGWLSFISQTNDIESARSQQCIHDYFKEANDKESFELFKAVLSGTDSILDYLKAEVIE